MTSNHFYIALFKKWTCLVLSRRKQYDPYNVINEYQKEYKNNRMNKKTYQLKATLKIYHKIDF